MKDNLSAFDSSEYDRKILQTLPFYEEFYRQTADLVRTVCGFPSSWLDVGCGTGKMGSEAYEHFDPKRFVFCDLSEGMVGVARKHFQKESAEFLVCDARELPFENEFDVVTAIQVFHFFHEDGRKKAVDACYKALRESGIFVTFENVAPFTETGRDVHLARWKNFQIKQGKSPEESEKHIARYEKDYFPITVEAHLNLLRESGFQTAEVFWLSYMQAGFWGRK
ncbi:MAG: class I SAM-dependent methyltransferase [Lachnospiraceae bacterium]|nr:class I SAM-dependent methyltransferase [Lachnospiraceae bacterium]